jgi:hypothetical protein
MEEYLCLGTSSVSADSLRCHVGREDSQTCGFDEALLGDSLSLPLLFDAKETQHPASSLLKPGREVS